MTNTAIVDILLRYLSDKIILSSPEVDMIRSVCIVKKLRKKQYLLQEGDVWKYHAFVSCGFLRTFSVDDKGNEHIMNFSPENYWAGDRASLSSGNPSRFFIEAIEDSLVVLILDQHFQELCNRIPQLNELVNAILHKSFIVSQDRIHTHIALSAEEKYTYFLEKYPGIANRIPQHMIASYIGVAPETLTRIRRNNVKK
ncbi:Crp/Fnr family transcriptional regulator [Taibaiella koreensis]|uniref:Crp/Fnr family transcriptional regulator n=1 Tax=Taibaiella koreensis TaxID=1268548 RepID=UPI0019693924|nr:Crp/Fnr family transcriptional regulator [Taibaiella koreensis]